MFNIGEKILVPIWEKSNLTINEATEYFNIGEHTLRKLLDEPGCKFVLYVGRKRLVKRREFEEWIHDRLVI